MDSGISGIVTSAERLSSQRVKANGILAVSHDEGRTRLRRLYQDGAAKIRFPATAGDPLEAILINTAGGLTGGDRVAWEAEIGAGASVVITTQASEKIYRAGEGRSEVDVRLSVGTNGRLCWLPQESIMFDRADFFRRLDVTLEPGAEILIAEATVFGRGAMGEVVRQGRFRDRWRVSLGERLVHAEDFAIGPNVDEFLRHKSVLNGAVAAATVLLVSENAESLLDPARGIVGDQGGASFWRVGGTGKLLARLYAGDGYDLRKRLMPLLALLNGQAGLPKAWSL